MKYELGPCPFCGGKVGLYGTNIFPSYRVICENEDACTEGFRTEQGAIDQWKRRSHLKANFRRATWLRH